MKTIRSILEEVMNYGYGQCDGGCSGDELTVDQALAEIEEVMNECKPSVKYCWGENKLEKIEIFGFENGTDKYQSNLHKALGKE